MSFRCRVVEPQFRNVMLSVATGQQRDGGAMRQWVGRCEQKRAFAV